MGFPHACIGSGSVESGSKRIVTWEVCAAGRGLGVDGVEPGVNPKERRHLRWTPPMCEAKQFGHFGNKKNTYQNAKFDDKGEVDKGE